MSGGTLQSLAVSLKERGDRPALIEFRQDDFRQWSFGELGGTARQLASGLIARGLKPQDRALLLGPNRADWVVSCLALLMAGGVPVPADYQMTEQELMHIVRDSDPAWVFTTRERAEQIGEWLRPARNGRKVVLLDESEGGTSGWRDLLAKAEAELPHVTAGDPAVLFYTSGTSGTPKGVPLSHRNIVANIEALLSLDLIAEDERVLLPLPLHHVYPFTVGMLAPLCRGALVILPYALTGPHIQRALRDGDTTGIVAVPRIYSELYRAIEGRVRAFGAVVFAAYRGALELSVWLERTTGVNLGTVLFAPLRRRVAPRLRILASGGSALDVDLARKLKGLGFAVATGYGLTETSPILTFNAPEGGRLETAGRPLPGVDLRIEKSEEAAEYGEVLARGPNVFAGYRNLPEENANAFTQDGYFRTGDLGFIDAEGFLHLTGRASSMIVLSGGENVWPEEIEEALERADSVREAGVLEHQDRLVAVIVPKPEPGLEEKALEERVHADVREVLRKLPTHHRIVHYLVDANPLPRNRLGKIRRGELRALYARLQEGRPAAVAGPLPIERMLPEDRRLLEDDAAQAAWEWLKERFEGLPLSPDSNLRFDLGIDSLDWVMLTLELAERTGAQLGDEAIGRLETVRDLLREIAAARKAERPQPDLVEQLRVRPDQFLNRERLDWLEPPSPWIGAFGKGVLRFNRFLMRGLFRLRTEGTEHLPEDGPYLLTPNHTSYLDALAVAAALPDRHLQRTYWGGWTGIMFANAPMRFLSRSARVIPVDAERSPSSSVALASKVLLGGFNLVWFSEGGISLSGELQKFRPGIGLLLSVRAVPVVPVWIEGSYEALPKGRIVPRLHPIRVRFGAPATPEEIGKELTGENAYQRVADMLRERVAALGRKGKG